VQWSDWSEWLHLALRWSHVFAAILWIGQTWLFTFLERAFADAEENPGNQVFMVHSGGFYVVEKRATLTPLPKTLHWFQWEAIFTWSSGVALLLLHRAAGALHHARQPLPHHRLRQRPPARGARRDGAGWLGRGRVDPQALTSRAVPS
jgi:hypothetical protein